MPCTAHAHCDNGVYCDGRELCMPGEPAADARGCVPGSSPCMPGQGCDEDLGRCLTDCDVNPDADGDNYIAVECPGGDDCDDSDGSVNPGVLELCDAEGRDEDCNPNTLAGPSQTDRDDDGYVSNQCCNIQSTGAIRCGLDCDDDERAAHPAHPEVCDDIDNDCDGAIDERVRATYYRDADGDLYGDPNDSMEGCVEPPGFVSNANDCDDTAITVYPGAPETCNEADDDCDTRVDEDVSPAPATAEHCGGCGLACPAGYTCDGTTCIDRPVKLVAGATSTCALTEAGHVYCWGGNAHGEVGIGSSALIVDRPERVMLPMRAIDIMVGSHHVGTSYESLACAVLEDETSARCWGTGVGNSPSAPPFPIPPGGMVQLSSGGLSRNSSGAVYALEGTTTWAATTLGPASQISGRCARNVTGEVFCRSEDGSVIPLPEVAGGALLSVGQVAGCATRTDGRLLCWSGSAPTLVSGLPTLDLTSISMYRSIAFGSPSMPPRAHGHACASIVDGRTYCWGNNDRGELGIGMASGSVASPTLVVTAERFTEVVVGMSHTCAISDSDEVWCWGANDGRLGTADTTDAHVPTRLLGFPVRVVPSPTP